MPHTTQTPRIDRHKLQLRNTSTHETAWCEICCLTRRRATRDTRISCCPTQASRQPSYIVMTLRIFIILPVNATCSRTQAAAQVLSSMFCTIRRWYSHTIGQPRRWISKPLTPLLWSDRMSAQKTKSQHAAQRNPHITDVDNGGRTIILTIVRWLYPNNTHSPEHVQNTCVPPLVVLSESIYLLSHDIFVGAVHPSKKAQCWVWIFALAWYLNTFADLNAELTSLVYVAYGV